MRIEARVGDLMWRRHKLGTRWPDDREAGHINGRDEKRGFPGLASKPMTTVCQWFGLKTTIMVYDRTTSGRGFIDLNQLERFSTK
jgi:hypothetical protein